MDLYIRRCFSFHIPRVCLTYSVVVGELFFVCLFVFCIFSRFFLSFFLFLFLFFFFFVRERS